MVSPEPSFSQASAALRRPSVGCSVSTISSFSSTLADIALKFFSSAATLSAFGATAARSSRLDARLTKPTRSAKPCDTGTWVETSLSSVIIDWLASPPSVMETMVMSAWAFSPAGSSTSLSLVWVVWAAFTISSPRALSLRRSSTAPSSAPSLVFIAAISFFSRSIASRSDWVRATSSSRFAMPSCRAFSAVISCCRWACDFAASKVGAEPASAWVSVCNPSVSTISGMLRPATPWKRSRTCENISQAAAPAMTVVPDTAAKAKKSLARDCRVSAGRRFSSARLVALA